MVTLSVSGGGKTSNGLKPAHFAFPKDYERAAVWFSEYFQQAVVVRHIPEGAPDDGLAPGPTIVSTASLQRVCELFPGIELHEARERFRATLEVDGVPAFWEDQLFGENENYPVRFRIGEIAFEGSNPCARCPVPPRNPRTGEDLVGFQKMFARGTLRSLLSPVHQYPRPLDGTGQTPARRRRAGALKSSDSV